MRESNNRNLCDVSDPERNDPKIVVQADAVSRSPRPSGPRGKTRGIRAQSIPPRGVAEDNQHTARPAPCETGAAARSRRTELPAWTTHAALSPEWVRWPEALRLFVRGATIRAAWRIAAIVGTLLSVVNQGGILLSGQATRLTLVRIAVNYACPFTVASLGYLLACRRPPAATSRPTSRAGCGQSA
ncbi:MAG: nitrate/nitrite transporter NrtS [Egibacteraceae bacterium]